MRFFLLLTILGIVTAYEKDITIIVQAGRMDCFYLNVLPNQVIDLEYQVIDSTHGELDISFEMADPVGRVIVADYKKPENGHKHTAALHGDYRFCFDNSFSTFTQKTVFFDIVIDQENQVTDQVDYDDKEMELGTSAESYMMKVQVISDSVTRVQDNLSAARRLQELHSAHEARDRNIAEIVNARVLRWSLIQMFLMLVIGILQVYFVRSLFEDQSGRSFRKLVPSFVSQ